MAVRAKGAGLREPLSCRGLKVRVAHTGVLIYGITVLRLREALSQQLEQPRLVGESAQYDRRQACHLGSIFVQQ